MTFVAIYVVSALITMSVALRNNLEAEKPDFAAIAVASLLWPIFVPMALIANFNDRRKK